MTRKPLEELSAKIREAISPPKRQSATTRILDGVEPLPILKSTLPEEKVESHDSSNSAQAPFSGTAPVQQTPGVSQPAAVTGSPEGTSVSLQPPSVTEAPAVSVIPVRGVTAIPNAILDSLLPQIEPFEQLVYLRLYRLSHGFRSETCLIGLDRLATVCRISPSTAVRAIRELEAKRLIRRLQAKLGGKMSESRGNQFWVFRPPVPQIAPVSQPPSVSQTPAVTETPNKEKDDDSIKKNHHQINTGSRTAGATQTAPVPGTTGGKKERETSASELLSHLAQTISTYTQLTKNPWVETDTAAYVENCLDQIPFDKIKSVMLAVSERAGCRINSFAYFVKEISASTNQGTVTARKRALATIVKRVRDNHVGRANYGMADLVYDVKSACLREGVVFANDVFNEILRGHG